MEPFFNLAVFLLILQLKLSPISINKSCIFRVVQVIKSLQDPLEVGNNLTGSVIVSGKEAWNRNVLLVQVEIDVPVCV